MPRLLIIAYYLPPMGGSGVQRPVKLAKYLQRLGYDVHLLAPEQPGYHATDESLLEELGPARDRIHRVRGATPLDLPWASVLLKSYREKWSGLIARLSHWLYLPDNKTGWIAPALARARELHREHPFDLVFATAAPYSNLMIASRMREELGIPVVMDLRDDWLESHHIRYPTRWHRARMARIERQTLRAADAITVINEAVARAVSSRHPSLPAPVVLPNGFDEEDLERARQRTGITLAHDPDRLTFLHNGLFYGRPDDATYYGRMQPDTFLMAAKKVMQERPELDGKLRLVFQGDLFPRHHALIERLGLGSSVVHTGVLSHLESVGGLLSADVLWLMIPSHPMASNVTPGKLFEYIGAGRPILALAPPGVAADLICDQQAGWVVDPDDPDAIAQTIHAIADAWRDGTLAGLGPHSPDDFSRREQAARLHEVFSKLAGRA
jgi:glycosyltransferase involved in cell wall biosynthesis